MPYLAALICASAFDIALYDAYGNLHGVDIYETLKIANGLAVIYPLI